MQGPRDVPGRTRIPTLSKGHVLTFTPQFTASVACAGLFDPPSLSIRAYLRVLAAPLSWCLAGPSLEGVREGARLLKTQEPSNVTDRKVPVVEIALSKVSPHLIEHLREGKVLRSKSPCQGPRTNPQRLGDRADASRAVRQERQDCVLDGSSDGTVPATVLC